MNYLKHDGFGDDRRARRGKVKLQVVAVGADKFGREIAFKGQAAALTKWRTDEPDMRPARTADQTAACLGAVGVAKLADRWIKQIQPDV